MLNKKLFLVMLLNFCGTSTFAAPPYTFSSGGTIRASEINANFTYLENLIANKTFLRASKSLTSNGVAQLVYTVPSNATQYLITNISVPGCGGGASITIGSDVLALTSGSYLNNLTIPVNAGESIYFSCDGGGITMSKQVFLTLSR